jgi:leukotriene-A4 hydrolase
MSHPLPVEPVNSRATKHMSPKGPAASDPHSFSNPHEIRVRHLDLELKVSFEEKALHCKAALLLKRLNTAASQIVLDTADLNVNSVQWASANESYNTATFQIGDRDPIRGEPLTIDLPPVADRVRIEYSTRPNARGLQWLEPQHTAGKTDPFLLTQSQAINARSWVPIQDSPQVRMTFSARVYCPKTLMAVMGAANNPQVLRTGEYHFEMPQPIPSYLLALAVGNLSFRSLGPRTGVYAEPALVESAAAEFSDLEEMMTKVEQLYGPYHWARYDILVLPPSFPVGGMENPQLTFATPTILAGDKSLVAVIAHELAHSWSGNLVTNATWNDFWLNEGFSVYVERRVIEEIYGKRRAEMEAALGFVELTEEIARLDDKDELLFGSCTGGDPEDCTTKVPYEKGALFLLHLERTFGRARFDQFLRAYFDKFAFQSITTHDFVEYLERNLIGKDPAVAETVRVNEWLYEPGIPASAPIPSSEAFKAIENEARAWLDGRRSASAIDVSSWSVQEWLHFLNYLPHDLASSKLAELDQHFQLTLSKNSEIIHQWLLLAIRGNYPSAFKRLEEFLISVGRERLIKPLFEELVKSDPGKIWARDVYAKARPSYSPIIVKKLDQVLELNR